MAALEFPHQRGKAGLSCRERPWVECVSAAPRPQGSCPSFFLSIVAKLGSPLESLWLTWQRTDFLWLGGATLIIATFMALFCSGSGNKIRSGANSWNFHPGNSIQRLWGKSGEGQRPDTEAKPASQAGAYMLSWYREPSSSVG